jgi:hypothetical protein
MWDMGQWAKLEAAALLGLRVLLEALAHRGQAGLQGLQALLGLLDQPDLQELAGHLGLRDLAEHLGQLAALAE